MWRSSSSNASFSRLESALEQLGAEHEPPPGWQTRVLAAIDEPRGLRRWWLALPVAAAIAICLSLVPSSPEPPSRALALRVDVVPTGPPMRGTAAVVGNYVHARATGGDCYRAIWVYRNERELVVVCPGGLSCGSAGGATTAGVTLLTVGSYTFVAVTSASPLPALQGSYDDDRAAAERSGAQVKSYTIEAR